MIITSTPQSSTDQSSAGQPNTGQPSAGIESFSIQDNTKNANNFGSKSGKLDQNLGSVLAIGVFDGFHQGHQFLLKQACLDARELGLPVWAVTFDRDPDTLFKPAKQLAKLSSDEARLRRLDEAGITGVFAVTFNREISQLQPVDFLNQILANAFLPKSIHIGADFHFGDHAKGSVLDLYTWGEKRGCTIHAHHLLCDSGMPVTATRIRKLLGDGAVEQAALLLTRPYSIQATVVAGRKLGTILGFPTANLQVDPSFARVADGVYAGLARLEDGSSYATAISQGVPATFGDLPSTIEATLLDFPEDAPSLYGQKLEVCYYQYLRPMKAFASVEELKAAIANNVAQTRDVIGKLGKL
jgi:riboflavin kinase/FMN adenylyltransferase